jgi:hypothetical protein
MSNMMKEYTYWKFWLLGLAVACCFILGCEEPNPLYGTWADNQGNSFTFNDDDTFNAKLHGLLPFGGSYFVQLNALTFKYSDPNTGESPRVVTEWDLRGNFLYLDWPVEGKTQLLKLGKTKN